MRKAVFRFEVRHRGELRLGLWRRKFRKGSREPRRLVLIPGFGDSPLSWMRVVTRLIPTLARNFDEIILLDFPGFHGLLSKDTACDSMDLLMSSVNECIESLNPDAVIGHSLGGWLGASYGIHAAQVKKSRLKNLILIAPSGIFGTPSEKAQWQNRFRSAALEGFEHLREVLFYKEPAWFKYVASEFGKFISRDDIKEFMQSIDVRHEVGDRLVQINCPVGIIWGDQDELVPVKWHREWLARLNERAGPPSWAVLLTGVGHSGQIEEPAITAQVVARFLERRKLEAGQGRFAGRWRVVG